MKGRASLFARSTPLQEDLAFMSQENEKTTIPTAAMSLERAKVWLKLLLLKTAKNSQLGHCWSRKPLQEILFYIGRWQEQYLKQQICRSWQRSDHSVWHALRWRTPFKWRLQRCGLFSKGTYKVNVAILTILTVMYPVIFSKYTEAVQNVVKSNFVELPCHSFLKKQRNMCPCTARKKLLRSRRAASRHAQIEELGARTWLVALRIRP